VPLNVLCLFETQPLRVIGTIGVLLDAKERGRIHEVKPLLEELMKNKIRISEELYNHALALSNEN